MHDFIHQQFGNKLLGQPSVKGRGLPTCPIKTNKNKIRQAQSVESYLLGCLPLTHKVKNESRYLHARQGLGFRV